MKKIGPKANEKFLRLLSGIYLTKILTAERKKKLLSLLYMRAKYSNQIWVERCAVNLPRVTVGPTLNLMKFGDRPEWVPPESYWPLETSSTVPLMSHCDMC